MARRLRAATRQLKKGRRGVAAPRGPQSQHRVRRKGGWCEVGLGVEKGDALNTGGLHACCS